ncbi:hypothetical protein ERO13_D01G183840v2 [Gossypium hirsutum]|nr:hypothetical protein ERO13_D01G183840v2 [Gossypium hirsutum]
MTSTAPVSLSFDCFVEPNTPFCSSNAVSREVQKQTSVLQIPTSISKETLKKTFPIQARQIRKSESRGKYS